MPRRPSDHVDDPVKVGQRLREARQRAGLRQRDLSFQGCTTAYVSRIEAGRRIPSFQILRAFASKLGVSAEYLATGEDTTEPIDEVAQAELALRFDDPATARGKFQAIVEASNDPMTRARAIVGLGHVAFELGDHEQAIGCYEESLRLEPELEEDVTLADNLGRAYAFTSHYTEAIGLFERRLAAADEKGDQLEVLRFSVLLANTLGDRGSFGRAEELAGRALNLADASRDPLARARVWWTQSRLHVLQNDSERAERYARMALDTLLLTDHMRYSAFAHQTLAHIKLDQGDATEALTLLQKGFPLVLEGGNGFEQGLFLADEARALVALDRLDEAELSATRAIELLEGTSQGDASRAKAVVAEIHEKRGDTDEAIRIYKEAADEAPQTARYKLQIYAKLASLMNQVGRAEEAVTILTNALEPKQQSPVD